MINESIIPNDKQYIGTEELHHLGFSQYKIQGLVKRHLLLPVNRRYYENLMYVGETNDFYIVNAVAERGIVCLVSAAVYYGLSDERMVHLDIALPRKSRIPQTPDWPAMQFYLFSPVRYSLGRITVCEGKNEFQIYDKEKTISDLVFYRNRFGLEPTKQAISRYLSQPDRNISKLVSYAEKLRVKTAMMNYLEVLV